MKKALFTSVLAMVLCVNAIAQTKTFSGYITQIICAENCEVLIGQTPDAPMDKTESLIMTYEPGGKIMKVNAEAKSYFTQREDDFILNAEYKSKKFTITCAVKGNEFIINTIVLEPSNNSNTVLNNTQPANAEKMTVYFIGESNPTGPVTTTSGNANKTYTKDSPLMSNYGAGYFTGTFVDGQPKGTIQKYVSDKLVEEYFFNDASEIIKCIKYDETNGLEQKRITEFVNKNASSYLEYHGAVLVAKYQFKSDQIIKQEEWYDSGKKKLERNYTVKANKRPNSPYYQSWSNMTGEKNGIFKDWEMDGKFSKDYTYLNGEKNGKCSDYKNGKLIQYFTFTNGVKNGKYAVYADAMVGYGPANADGLRTVHEGTYVNGKRPSYKQYKEDGSSKTMAD